MAYYGTQVTAKLLSLLSGIDAGAGYKTNIGANVFVGETKGTPTDLPAIYVVPAEENGALEYGVSVRQKTYRITVYADKTKTQIADYPADPFAVWVMIDAFIADVFKALETPNAFSPIKAQVQFRGARPQYDDVNAIVGAEFDYAVQFAINRSNPDTTI